MKKLFSQLLTSALIISLSTSGFAQQNPTSKKEDALVEIQILKNDKKNIEAQIVKIDDKQSSGEKNISIPSQVKIIGVKKQSVKNGQEITDIVWNKVSNEKNTKELKVPFRSSIVAKPEVEKGDKFKAKGDQKALLEAIAAVATTTKSNPNSSGDKKSSVNSSSSDVASSGSNTSKLSTLSSLRQSADSVTTTETGDIGTETTTTSGCSVRVDYQLNKVFVQERTLLDGEEVDSCHDSSTSFSLQKDYDSCPKVTDTNSAKIIPYFQYYYIDSNDSKNLIDDCQADEARATSLEITKVACDDYVNITSKVAYAQNKQYYKDTDGKDVLLSDCAIDSTKSYTIAEDYETCGIRHAFDLGYSVQRSRLYYIKNDEEVVVQQCQDTTTKYTHYSTSETCSPIIEGSAVTTFARKYITVDGVKSYISDCEPSASNVSIREENCSSTPFTHDFTAGQSYRNKNYYYLDDSSNRVEVSSCVKSDEVFTHSQDTSVCSATYDDIGLKTTLSARIYITVDNSKTFISDCASVTPTVPYTQIGYKWVNEYNLSGTSLAWTGGSNNTYIGSKQGVEANDFKYYDNATSTWKYSTKITNIYDIATYSTSNKCSTPSSFSYSSNAIDLTYSNITSIQYDNYVATNSSSSVCYSTCTSTTQSPEATICRSWSRTCSSGSNSLYYQMCNNYRCPVYKYNKKPIYRRNNNTEYVNNSETLETKYTCGEGGLSSTIVYY